MFRAVYSGDPNDETLATFYGMIQRIPDSIKQLWRPSPEDVDGRLEEMIRNEVAIARLENIGD